MKGRIEISLRPDELAILHSVAERVLENFQPHPEGGAMIAHTGGMVYRIDAAWLRHLRRAARKLAAMRPATTTQQDGDENNG